MRLRHTGSRTIIQLRLRQAALALAHGREAWRSNITITIYSTLCNISKCDNNVEYVVLVLIIYIIIIGSVCLSLCLCVLAITAQHSNAKSQPQ